MSDAVIVDLETGEVMEANEAEVLSTPAVSADELDDALAILHESLGSPEPDWEVIES